MHASTTHGFTPARRGVELSAAAPSSLGRLLRCSDVVLSRLTYTFLRTATNGRKFHLIRSMASICCQPSRRWHSDNPPFLEWLGQGEEDRRMGKVEPWGGWLRGAPPNEVDWWEGTSSGLLYGSGSFIASTDGEEFDERN
jgi:hypothetical protein